MKRRDFLRSASAAAGLITLAGCEASDEPEPEPEVIEDVDVAVVGGGLSGLVAARTVLAGGRSVRFLEARDRVGGRTFNQAVAGAVVEGGGQWVGPTQTELLALADELGVATFATYNTGQSVLMFDGFRFTSDELPADPAEEADIERAIDALDALAATVPLD
ncbi:MAG: FAD-dependent oxidoreductase, partial [Myxococcota bacterium]